MIIANHKPIKIIGYTQSSMTQEFFNEISKTHNVSVIDPQQFLSMPNKQSDQYIVSVSLDLKERQQIIALCDQQELDMITVIQDHCLLGVVPPPQIGPGTFVFAFSNIAIGSSIGRHCIIGEYTLIGHHVKLGKNCILRPNVMIIDKSQVGDNCVINTRSTITNKATVCNDVELMGFSAITKTVTCAGRYIGTPARKIQQTT
jgi:UDP-3-O-[3-hydroxymyristoyl] glucosamine N-acyltransferase